MVTLSAFADEIATDLSDQIAALTAAAIGHVDVRAVGGRNIVTLEPDAVRATRVTLDEHGIGVASLASPIGKVQVDTPLADLQASVELAATYAHILGTPMVRVFSFYRSEQSDSEWRDLALERLGAMTLCARDNGITLLVENEKRTYAATVKGAREIVDAFGGDHLGTVLDAANYAEYDESPFPDAYEALKDHIRQVHVKDVAEDGTMVVAGQGTCRWPELLDALKKQGYNGFLSLEPHLRSAGQFGGFTGPDLFPDAVAALRKLLADLSWEESA